MPMFGARRAGVNLRPPVVALVFAALAALAALVGCGGPPPTGPATTPPAPAARAAQVIVVPEAHGTVAGWLVDFPTERNYMVNNLVAHLDRLAVDPRYTFALTEVPTMIALAELQPDRLAAVRRHLAEGRLDLGNAFYLNTAADLMGGEALVRLGVEGIRWQEAAFGVRPRVAALVDATGLHRQLPQIAARLGLRGLVYTRNNPAGVVTYRWHAPDGSSILTSGIRSYAHWSRLFEFVLPATEGLMRSLERELDEQRRHDRAGVPTLLVAARGDYGGPPVLPEQVGLVLGQWPSRRPHQDVRFGTLSEYFDLLERTAPDLGLPDVAGDAPMSYNAFWSNAPPVKQATREAEHLLQASELLAAFGSLDGRVPYPAERLHAAWINLLLNLDRNVAWGAASGEVFASATAWDAHDRFEAAAGGATAVLDETLAALVAADAASGDDVIALFNPLSWARADPIAVRSPGGRALDGVPCEALPDDREQVLCQPPLPSAGYRTFRLAGPAPAPEPIALPQVIETPFYRAHLDRRTGGIVGVWAGPSGSPVVDGPANLVVAEQDGRPIAPGDFLSPRGGRRPVGAADDGPASISATRGPVATTVRVEQPFLGGQIVRTTRFYANHPRIDFETELAGVADATLVLADFRLASRVETERHGIPFGFGEGRPGAGPRPTAVFLADDQRRLGFTDAMRPAIRWSSYDLGGTAPGPGPALVGGAGRFGPFSLHDPFGATAGGSAAAGRGVVALLDRGVPGRELWGHNVALHLLNAHEAYRGHPNPWASGRPARRFAYALLVGDAGWEALDVPRRAWEFNAGPRSTAGRGPAGAERSWLTASPNVIVESVRRDGADLEVRFVEWLGRGGEAEVEVAVPHLAAARTDLLGERAQPLPVGRRYRLPVAPQEIVTLRLRTADTAPTAPPITDYRPLAPPAKRPSFDLRHDRRGHPE